MPTKKPDRKRKITPKIWRFIDEYLIDLNASQAAKRAGYSERTCNEIGAMLANDPAIRPLIDERIKQRSMRAQITADRVLQEIARLALFDPRGLFGDDGQPKPIHELSDDAASAIGGLEVVSIGNADVGIGQVMKYKIADKNSALEKLCKHLGLFNADKSSRPEVNITGFRMVPDE